MKKLIICPKEKNILKSKDSYFYLFLKVQEKIFGTKALTTREHFQVKDWTSRLILLGRIK